MPTYEYACTTCGHRLEAVQRFSDDPLTECPECGGALRKVYGAVGIVLKGSGFYKNDSRVATGANGSGSQGAKTAEAAAGDSSGSDAAPKKTETAPGAGDGSSAGNGTRDGAGAKSAATTAG